MSRQSSRSRSRTGNPLIARRPRADSDLLVLNSDHTAIHAGRTVVITGAASGIGFAAARRLAHLGLHICMADVDEAALTKAGEEIKGLTGPDNILVVPTDVSRVAQVEHLRDEVFKKFGEVNILLHAAAIGKARDGSVATAFGNMDAWKQVLDVNLGGTINVVQTFTTVMNAQENPSLIILTGSKQGITNPPGNPAYNVSKAGVRFLAENLSHELRTRAATMTAHLFIPGWTYTGMTGANEPGAFKPEGAWTADETVLYMLDRVRLGDFYILCPDNETSGEIDALRMRWAAEDISSGRPALSRWHPEYAPQFAQFVQEELEHVEN